MVLVGLLDAVWLGCECDLGSVRASRRSHLFSLPALVCCILRSPRFGSATAALDMAFSLIRGHGAATFFSPLGMAVAFWTRTKHTSDGWR
ncbi:hypothetical protein IWX50DRAFT_116778 [Phyllosticta citricarpa]